EGLVLGRRRIEFRQAIRCAVLDVYNPKVTEEIPRIVPEKGNVAAVGRPGWIAWWGTAQRWQRDQPFDGKRARLISQCRAEAQDACKQKPAREQAADI